MYSDSTGGGVLAITTFFPRSNSAAPILPNRATDGELNALAASTNPIYIYELFATVASIFQLREQLTGKRAIVFADNEAACAALTTGTAKMPGALLLVYAIWAFAAQHDIEIWTERVATGANPADLSSRDRELSFPTEPVTELVSLSVTAAARKRTL